MTDKKLFPKMGCSLEVLEHLASLPEVKDDFTTADVCFKYIFPLTKPQEGLPARSYAGYIQSQPTSSAGKYGQPLIGIANQFLSHAWSFNFKETVQNLVTNVHKHVTNKEELARMYFWMDIVAVNQHIGQVHGSIAEDFWYVAFSNAISSMERTFFLFDSYRDPVHTKRVWCIWELITAITSTKNTPILCLHDKQMVDLESTLRQRDAKLGNMFSSIDCRYAEATVDSDRVAILSILEKGLGYDRINAEVSKWLRDWLMDASLKLAQDNNLSVDDLHEKSQEERCAQLRFSENIAWLMESVGDLDGAVKGYKRCIELGEVFFTTGSERTQLFIIKTNLASAYSRIAAVDEMTALLASIKETGEELLKEGHLGPDTFASYLMILASSQTHTSAQDAVKTLEEAVEKVDGELKKIEEGQKNSEEEEEDEEEKQESIARRVNLINMRLQMLRNMAVSRNSYEEPNQVREFLSQVAIECENEYGDSDARVLRMRYMVAKNNLTVASLKGQLSLEDLKTGLEDVEYVMRGLAQLQTDAERSPMEGSQERMIYFLCVGDLFIDVICKLKRVESSLIDRVCRFHEDLVALETRGLDMMRDLGNAHADDTSNLLNINFTFARVLTEISESPGDHINQRIEALEAVAAINPSMTAGRSQAHVQSMLVSIYGIRNASGDEEKAKLAQKAYVDSVIATPNDPGLGINQKRTQQYVAIIRLLELKQFDKALAMAKAAIAIDEEISAKAVEERTTEEAEIINNPNWTQYNSNWLKNQMAKAYMGLGEYQLALKLCKACMAGPVAGVDLSTNPFLQQFLGEVMAKAKCPPNEFGQEFAKVLTKFGYKDGAVGVSTLVMWLKLHAMSELDAVTSDNNNKVVALTQQWINDTLLPVLMAYDKNVKREVFIAVLRYRITQVVTEVNEELQKGTNGSDSVLLDLPGHISWIDDELQLLAAKITEKSSEESSETKRRSSRVSSIRSRHSSKKRVASLLIIEGQAKVAHDVATQIFSALDDGPCAIHWWGESMAHSNRISQMRANASETSKSSSSSQFPFTPESMLPYISALLSGGRDNYPKAILVLEIGLAEFTKTDKASKKPLREGDLLTLAVLLGKLSVAMEDYKTALKWFEWALQLDELIDGTQMGLNDIWVDPSVITPVSHALMKMELAPRAIEVVNIAKRHKGYTNVLNLCEQLEKWANSFIATQAASTHSVFVSDKDRDVDDQEEEEEVVEEGDEPPAAVDHVAPAPAVVESSEPEESVSVSKENTTPKPVFKSDKRTKSTARPRSSKTKKNGNCTIC